MKNNRINEQTRKIKIEPPGNEKKSPWYLLTGLILGIAAGLVFTWMLFPVQYQDTSPATLAEGYKEIYRRTIAEVFSVTGDLDRAISRLNLLQDEDKVLSLGEQAQRALADGRDKEAQALALLASATGSGQTTGEAQPPQITPSIPPGEPSLPTQTLPVMPDNP
jgi:hypothetical protein